jgi:Domain of unknown function (DUF397)
MLPTKRSSANRRQPGTTRRTKLGNTSGVRDSKDPDGGELLFSADEWSRFIQAIKHGEFGL